MKIIIVMILLNAYQATAALRAQQISISVRQQSLKAVLKEIEKQSGYIVWYKSGTLDHAGMVSLNLNGVSLPDALKACFEKQPLTYELVDKTIVVKQKETGLIEKIKNLVNKLTVTGRVTDERGIALSGVNVAVKGTNIVTTTDNNGNFSIGADENAILVFTYIGFDLTEVPVNGRLNLALKMKESQNELDQVQIVGYGTTTRRLSTGNVATIKSDVIEKAPVGNALLALQGRVPGLFIQQTTGFAGGAVNLNIQGQNSMRSGNEAFYVVDGIPYEARTIGSTVTPGTIPGAGQGVSTLNFINPNDIESIEILKDADATAIYGSRAANGAVLITTKKGKAGDTKVDFNLQSGIGKAVNRLQMMNAAEYLEMRKEALANDGRGPNATDYDLNGAWDQTRNVNWWKEINGGTSRFDNLQASISGGTAFTQYFVGAGYIKETSVLPTKFGNSKGSVRFNLNHRSVNQRFIANFIAGYLMDKNELPISDMSSQAINLAPIAPPLYNSNGSLNWQYNGAGTSTFSNPIAILNASYTGRTNNVNLSANLGYELFKGLQFKSNLGYKRLQSSETNILPQTYFDPNLAVDGRLHNVSDKFNDDWIIEPQLNYRNNFSFGSLDLLVGSSLQSSDSELITINGSGFGSDAQLENIRAASRITIANTIDNRYRYNAIFGRLNYNYQSRYIINLAARRDGSSRFGPENLFNNFYSVGAAWIFTEEKFFGESLKFLSFGKLKSSYGTTGNDQIGDYKYLNLYNNFTSAVANPYQGIVGVTPSGHSNPYLQWEETQKFDVGLDLGFFNNRILFNGYYYRNRSSNQLLTYPLPTVTGFPNVQRNLPAVVGNTGWEFVLEGSPIKTAHLNWNSSINLTINKNRLIEYPGLAQSSLASSFVIGQPINIQMAYDMIGVNPQTGNYEYRTATGSITSTPNQLSDRTQLIDLNPKFFGGWSNAVSFKNFSLDVLVTFVKQQGLTTKFGIGTPGYFFGSTNSYNQPVGLLSRWQKPGDITQIAKFSATAANVTNWNNFARQSDLAYGDASYLRLKNVSLSYHFDPKLLQSLKVKQLRVFAQGQNLLTYTNYLGGDPETRSATILPPLRVITFGAQLTL